MEAIDQIATIPEAPKLEDVPVLSQIPNTHISEHRFMKGDAKLLESGNFADIVVVCGDKTWKLHKSILIRCEWFEKALTGNFEEARSNTITLTEFSPDIVDSVIRYIYTGVVGFAPGTMEDSPLSAFVKLWVAADFFVFNQLMNEATTLIETYFDEKLAKIALSYTNLDVNSPNYIDSFLDQLFKGVASAFSKSPHSRPCQKLIVDFIHAGRFFFYANGKFRNLLACASQHFAHKVFLATVQGNISRWTGPEGCYSEYDSIVPFGRTCSHCCKEGGLISNQWICDPFVLSARPENFSLFIKTRWRCREWVREHGFKGRGS